MLKILTFLPVFLLLLTLTTAPALAANPSATVNISPDKRFATLSFTNLASVAKVNYTFTYQTGARTTGTEGSIRTLSRTSRTSRRLLIGTCSTKRCVYDKNPRNFKLETTFVYSDGRSTNITKYN